jgi:hypothetical protein
MATTPLFKQQDDADQIFAIKTWRYLRVCMIGLVLGIFIAVGFEIAKTHPSCYQTSISAYYYTPVHGFFIGALVAIGACLICLRGNTDGEDILLNLAGMFAPVVALVPTPGTGTCGSVLTTTENRDVNIGNNMFALLIVGLVGFLFLATFTLIEHRKNGRTWPPPQSTIGYAVTLAVWAYAAVTFWGFRSFFTHTAHYSAAITMFVCFLLVVILDAISYKIHKDPYLDATASLSVQAKATVKDALKARNPYLWIAIAMILDAIAWGIVGLGFNWPHWIFWVEATIILLFALFWGWQTVELWNNGLRGQSATSGRSDPGTVNVPPTLAATAGPKIHRQVTDDHTDDATKRL